MVFSLRSHTLLGQFLHSPSTICGCGTSIDCGVHRNNFSCVVRVAIFAPAPCRGCGTQRRLRNTLRQRTMQIDFSFKYELIFCFVSSDVVSSILVSSLIVMVFLSVLLCSVCCVVFSRANKSVLVLRWCLLLSFPSAALVSWHFTTCADGAPV